MRVDSYLPLPQFTQHAQVYSQVVFAAPAFVLADAFTHAEESHARKSKDGLGGHCYVYRFDFAASALGAAHAVELGLVSACRCIHLSLSLSLLVSLLVSLSPPLSLCMY